MPFNPLGTTGSARATVGEPWPVFLFSPTIRHYWEGRWSGPFVEPWRRLYDCELVYVSEGSADLHVGAVAHRCRAGTLAVMPPRLRHESLVASGGYAVRHCVHFDWVPPPADIDQRPLWAFEHERFEALGQTVAPPPEIAVCLPLVVALRDLAWDVQPALEKALAAMRAGHYESAGGWLWPVLNASLRHVALHVAAPVLQAVGGAALVAVHAAKDYMDRHYAAPMTLPQLARLTRVSPNHLCVTFRRVVGKPPNQYLNDLRVQHACRLLGTSPLNVAEVAARVGIPDANYFARLFKRKTGYRPGDYANQPSEHTRGISRRT